MTTRENIHETGVTAWLAQQSFSIILVFSSMVSAIYGQGQSLKTRLDAVREELAASLRILAETASLAEVQKAEGEGEKTGLTILGLSGIALVLVIIGVVVLCIVPVCVILILALLGPAVGDVFSNINEGI